MYIKVWVPKTATPSKSPSVDFSTCTNCYTMEFCRWNHFDERTVKWINFAWKFLYVCISSAKLIVNATTPAIDLRRYWRKGNGQNISSQMMPTTDQKHYVSENSSILDLVSFPMACHTGPDRRSTGVRDFESSNVNDAPDTSNTQATARCPKCRALWRLLHPDSPSWEMLTFFKNT